MNCTRCDAKILKGEKYHRTKRGPYHAQCPHVSVAIPNDGGPAVVTRDDAHAELALSVKQTDSWIAKANREQQLRIEAEKQLAEARAQIDRMGLQVRTGGEMSARQSVDRTCREIPSTRPKAEGGESTGRVGAFGEARIATKEASTQYGLAAEPNPSLLLEAKIHNRFCGENGEPCQVCKLKAEREEK